MKPSNHLLQRTSWQHHLQFAAVATSLTLDVITEDKSVEILMRVLADTSEESIVAESEYTIDDVRDLWEDLAIAATNVRNLGGTVQRDDGQDMAEGRRLALQFGGNNNLYAAYNFVHNIWFKEGPKSILEWMLLLIPPPPRKSRFTERVLRIMIGLLSGDPNALNRSSSPSTVSLPTYQPSTSSQPTFDSVCPNTPVGYGDICCVKANCPGGLECVDTQGK